MIEFIFALLCLPVASYGLCYLIRSAEITEFIRMLLYRIPFLGIKFFHPLLECAFCTGVWTSAFLMCFYCLVFNMSWWLVGIWALTGAVICYWLDLRLELLELAQEISNEEDSTI